MIRRHYYSIARIYGAVGTTQYDPMTAIVYDFANSRSGHHASSFLTGWAGKLVCDDFSG